MEQYVETARMTRGPTPTTRRSPGQGGKEIRARVSAAEYAEVQARATALGLTVPAYVLRVLIDVAGRAIDLGAIEARWEATTPERWRLAHHGTWEVQAPPNQRVADFGTIDRAKADAVFAAHAHQDIPALCAEVRRLQALVSR